MQWEDMIAHIDGAKSLFTPMQLSSGAPLRLNCCMFYQKDQACTVLASVGALGGPF